jgi:hypothetical protein
VRKQVVEPVIGQIKQARGIRRFSFRGLAKVMAEWKLICATHNMLKLFRSRLRLQTAKALARAFPAAQNDRQEPSDGFGGIYTAVPRVRLESRQQQLGNCPTDCILQPQGGKFTPTGSWIDHANPRAGVSARTRIVRRVAIAEAEADDKPTAGWKLAPRCSCCAQDPRGGIFRKVAASEAGWGASCGAGAPPHIPFRGSAGREGVASRPGRFQHGRAGAL